MSGVFLRGVNVKILLLADVVRIEGSVGLSVVLAAPFGLPL